MKALGILGGVIGFLLSLFCQMFAIVDDSYTFGNIGILGMASGIAAIIGAAFLVRRRALSSSLLFVSSITGIISISFLYIPSAVLSLIPAIYTLTKLKKNKEVLK